MSPQNFVLFLLTSLLQVFYIYFVFILRIWAFHGYLWIVCHQCPWRLEEGTRSSGTGVTDSDLLGGCWELNLGPWQEQQCAAISTAPLLKGGSHFAIQLGLSLAFCCLVLPKCWIIDTHYHTWFNIHSVHLFHPGCLPRWEVPWAPSPTFFSMSWTATLWISNLPLNTVHEQKSEGPQFYQRSLCWSIMLARGYVVA